MNAGGAVQAEDARTRLSRLSGVFSKTSASLRNALLHTDAVGLSCSRLA